MDEADRHWSSIDFDILLLIYSKIASLDDCIRFSAVCRSWHSLATDPTNKPPPSYMSGESNNNVVTLRNPASNQTLALTLPLDTDPPSRRRIFWGSPFGWLVAFNLKRFTLLNPFSGAVIDLPDNLIGTWEPTSRGFLTASPYSDPHDFAVLIVSENLTKIAFCKPGNKNSIKGRRRSQQKWKWTYKDLERSSGFNGVTYFRGYLYGIQYQPTRVVAFQNDRFVPIVTLFHHPNLDYDPCGSFSQKYLVELNGQLCLCVRYQSLRYETIGCTQGYKFFEIDLSTGNLTLVTSLGGHCVFINPNYSFSFKASYPPTRLFEQWQHQHEFVSNYVFYCRLYYDTEVWDVLRSCIVYEKRLDSLSNIQSLWIIPPM